MRNPIIEEVSTHFPCYAEVFKTAPALRNTVLFCERTTFKTDHVYKSNTENTFYVKF